MPPEGADTTDGGGVPPLMGKNTIILESMKNKTIVLL